MLFMAKSIFSLGLYREIKWIFSRLAAISIVISISCSTSETPNEVIDLDSDGDGITDQSEVTAGSDPDDPCDPAQYSGYNGYDSNSTFWAAADCDGDGIPNLQEVTDGTDPYRDEITDSDGDGISDFDENLLGTSVDDPCDPAQNSGYDGFDPNNEVWSAADCDLDGLSNSQEIEEGLDPYVDERIFASSEWQPFLSEMGIFKGDIAELEVERTTISYQISTPLYSDYAHKLRTISLPRDGRLVLDGNGLLEFPENTVITKTFFYFLDERNPSLGRQIIETRVLIKKNGLWEMGNYLWNDSQGEASLDQNSHIVPVAWVDANGQNWTNNYRVPSIANCALCHKKDGGIVPIGPKARGLDIEINGQNQLQAWSDMGLLESRSSISEIQALPNWEDLNYSLEDRARAYMDVNCAHCHQPGNDIYPGTLDLRYEIGLAESEITLFANDIKFRISTAIPSLRMPPVATNIAHEEGISLMDEYIDSL